MKLKTWSVQGGCRNWMTGSSEIILKFLIFGLITFIFSLPYTEASLREIMRYETLLHAAFPHRAMKDTTLAGKAFM